MTPQEEINKLWCRNKSDELAIGNGCFFEVARGAFAVWWIERYCKLYEGKHATEPMLVRSGCPDVDKIVTLDWDEGGEEESIKRAAKYAEWIAEGGEPDWQYECTMRLFGWAKWSDFHKQNVRRFTEAVVFIAKKNKKTPTLAAWGLHLNCGDGELGAKCFAAARDGKQACLAMNHAIAMVEQCDELAGECKINRNEHSITHIGTRSKFEPLSSSNINTQVSKEGLNGNVFIDEIHIVDRAFIARINRTGISRTEPMRIEVSTAGNNPDGYGKERQDYARQVLLGAELNDNLFVAIYEAPQDLTPEDLALDPLKYGRMANPSWGHTINPEEYLADYKTSKRSISSMADFMMYRLNIWQRTANIWIKPEDWDACREPEFTVEDLRGKSASIGMDLSRTRDMSALSAVIPVGNVRYVDVKIFTTEEFIRKQGHKADFAEWASSGELIVIPGETIDYEWIWNAFIDYTELLKVSCLVYDKTFANELIEKVEKKFGTRILSIDYPQAASAMENPIDEFEASIIERKIRHFNNRCLNWQAGHASVKPNAVGHRRIVKPYTDDFRKIDAMVATVMADYGVKHLKKTGSVYSRRGVLCG